MRCEDEVAVYVRVFVRAMKDPEPKMLNELRQLDAKIGLSPRALLDLRWEIDEAVVEEPVLEEDHLAYVPDPEAESNGNLRTFVPKQREENG